MTTLHYWNSLLVLLLFLTFTPNTKMENAPNQELMDSAKNIVQKIKSIQKHCKDNNIDLKTFLSKEDYKEYQTSLAFIKKYLPQIKVDALALKEEAKNTKEPIDEDISEPAFIDAVLQWRNTLLENLKSAKTKYAEVAIDPSNFSLSIGSNLSALPLNTSLYQEWKSVVAKIQSPSTGAIIFEALIQNSSETWVLTGNVEKLTSHYRKAANKKVYKQYENNIASFKNQTLPQIALFITAIKASTDSKDKNLPNNIKAKEEADKAKAEADNAKAEAYQTVLNAWLDREVTNLSIETGDDTVYVDMSMINAGDPRVSVHNLPIELKSNLLTTILTEAKKAGSRRQSVKNLKNIAISALNTFHSQNLHKEESYQNLTLEEIEVIKFPTNISGWILNYLVPNKETDPKIKEYETILENWYTQQQSSLDSTNASEHLIIDPLSLDISSGLAHSVGIPSSMHKELLSAIKGELTKTEKETGHLNFNQAAALALKSIGAFYNKYNIDNTIFDYKSFSLEEIRKFNFPTGIHHWIKDAEAPGVKKDVKKDLKTQLDITLKNTNNFNLEALIKELKIDMGGLTINNDFNFDNDMNLTYNSLSLILKELIEINQSKKTDKKSKTKIKTASADLVIKDFYTSYYNGCHYGGSLKLKLNSKEDAKGTYTLTFGKDIGLVKTNASLLNLHETLLEKTPSIQLKKNEKKVIKISFAFTYKYNKETSISKTRDNAYTIIEVGGNVGAEVSIRFAKLYAGADFKQINVPQKEGETATQGSTNKIFTDYYTFDILVENTEGGIELSINKDISFADSSYARILPQLKEAIGLCGAIEIQ
jgi:hypothetical protein